MDVFQYAVNAILPLILEIGLGKFMRRCGMWDEKFFRQCRKMVFFLMIPLSIFCSICNAQSIGDINWILSLYTFAIVLALFGIGSLVAMIFPDKRKRGIIAQCAYRSNYSIIAIPLAQALGGQAGLTTVALLSITTIPQYNALAVISMTMFIQNKSHGSTFKSTLKNILRNPMVIACIAGIACLLIRSVLPRNADGMPVVSLSGTVPFVYTAINAIGKMATPMALITLGGLFDYKCLRGNTGALILGTTLRTVIAPVVALSGAYLLSRMGLMQMGMAEYACLIGVFASPLSTVTGVMAAQMRNDDVLADQLVVSTAMFSGLSIFVIVCILRSNSWI